MADGADGHALLEGLGHLGEERLGLQVLAHARRVPAREHEPIEGADVDAAPRDRLAEGACIPHLLVEGLRLRFGAELPEDDPREEERITRGRAPSALRGEHHLVALAREDHPWDGDLGHVEVAIGEGDEHARHSASVPTRAPSAHHDEGGPKKS
jgi:hypothetical protein